MRNFAKKKFEAYLESSRAGDLEEELFRYAVDESQIPMSDFDFDCVRQIYKCKLRGLLTAFATSNVLETMNEGNKDLRDLVYMSPSELCPEVWKDLLSSQNEPTENTQVEEKARYGEAACTNCLRRGQPCHQTTYSQLQTRSADEGLTTYFLCYNCGKRWRQS